MTADQIKITSINVSGQASLINGAAVKIVLRRYHYSCTYKIVKYVTKPLINNFIRTQFNRVIVPLPELVSCVTLGIEKISFGWYFRNITWLGLAGNLAGISSPLASGVCLV